MVSAKREKRGWRMVVSGITGPCKCEAALWPALLSRSARAWLPSGYFHALADRAQVPLVGAKILNGLEEQVGCDLLIERHFREGVRRAGLTGPVRGSPAGTMNLNPAWLLELPVTMS